jgi:hypothetical protein
MPLWRKKRPVPQVLDERRSPEVVRLMREIAFAAIRSLYWESLPLWRACKRPYCRRHKRCIGDIRKCLAHGWPKMPPALQERAWQQVMAGGPNHLPPATREEKDLRRYPPSNFVH